MSFRSSAQLSVAINSTVFDLACESLCRFFRLCLCGASTPSRRRWHVVPSLRPTRSFLSCAVKCFTCRRRALLPRVLRVLAPVGCASASRQCPPAVLRYAGAAQHTLSRTQYSACQEQRIGSSTRPGALQVREHAVLCLTQCFSVISFELSWQETPAVRAPATASARRRVSSITASASSSALGVGSSLALSSDLPADICGPAGAASERTHVLLN